MSREREQGTPQRMLHDGQLRQHLHLVHFEHALINLHQDLLSKQFPSSQTRAQSAEPQPGRANQHRLLFHFNSSFPETALHCIQYRLCEKALSHKAHVKYYMLSTAFDPGPACKLKPLTSTQHRPRTCHSYGLFPRKGQ